MSDGSARPKLHDAKESQGRGANSSSVSLLTPRLTCAPSAESVTTPKSAVSATTPMPRYR